MSVFCTRSIFGMVVVLLATICSTNAMADLITTSGTATGGDVAISMDVTFNVTQAGAANILRFGTIPADANRDAVRFTSDQLTVHVNGVAHATSFQDLNDGDGIPGSGTSSGVPSYLDEFSWIFLGNAPNVSPGDTLRIFGSATGGTYQFGNSATTFTTPPTGDYSLNVYDVFTNTDLTAVPEPTSFLTFGIGMAALATTRRRVK